MRKVSFLILILFSGPVAYAQWAGKAGINFIPLIYKSVEVTSEFSNRPWYALTGDVGYTFNTNQWSMFDPLVYDSHEGHRTSGFYSRLGARLYTPGFGPSRKVRFYVNPLVVISNYRQTAFRMPEEGTNQSPVKVSASGTVLIPALRIGFTRPVSEKLTIDFGMQKALNPERDDIIGLIRSRNYQPGTGSGQSTDRIGYLQGYLALKVGF